MEAKVAPKWQTILRMLVLLQVANNSHGTGGPVVFEAESLAYRSIWDDFETKRFISVKRGCGRMKNRLLTSSNGERYCARYRDNVELLQGEYFSYVTAVALKITSVPQVFVAKVEPNSKMWSTVWKELADIDWKPNSVVTLTKWIDGLRPVVAPKCIQLGLCCNQANDSTRNNSNAHNNIWHQWSDLIILDYVTGNVDRIVSHMYNEKWDADSMKRPVHNLALTNGGDLVALDNESGFQHSYRLLDTFQSFHERMLSCACSLHHRTKVRLKRLAISPDLQEEFIQLSAHNISLPQLPVHILATLKERLNYVLEHLPSI